jgi:hypothetical protein
MVILLIEWVEVSKREEFGLTATMLIQLMLLSEVINNLGLVEKHTK